MSTASQLSENSHQGFDGLKAALCLGSMEAKSNTASGMPLRLRQNSIGSRSTGKERDQETGLDYFGARYYSGAEGRFTSPDPLLNSGKPWNPQTWNRYAYVSNNPLRYTDPKGLYQFAASGCSAGDKECEKQYKKNKKHFKDSLTYLEMARNEFGKKSSEYQRLDAALQAYGKEDKGGPTIKFDSLGGRTAGRTSPDGSIVTLDPAKMKSENTDRWFAIDVGHEGTHVSDIGLGASSLSDFSKEYRGYETSAFVFQGLFTPPKSASTGTTFGGVAGLGLTYGFGEIWNTSWAAADANAISSRGAAITNTVKGIYGHDETTPHNPWTNK